MRVELKGLYWTEATLADGTIKRYYYAWKNGPRIHADFGTQEFLAEFNAAIATKYTAPEGRLRALIQGFERSSDFLDLSVRSRIDYEKYLIKIDAKFGDMPVKALADPRTRGILLDWRDELALTSKRAADYAWSILARVLSRAKNRGKIPINPCEKAGRLYDVNRVDHVWTEEQEAIFLASAPAHLHLPLVAALWTGQRQGDLLRLTWSAYDGQNIRIRQSKTGERVLITVGAPLKLMLDATPRISPIILVNSEGRPWTSDGFRASFFKARNAAKITDVTFNDLRGTAVTRLALVGCTEAQIASITGHSLRDVRSILDAHYLHRDPALAREAITKLELAYANKSQT